MSEGNDKGAAVQSLEERHDEYRGLDFNDLLVLRRNPLLRGTAWIALKYLKRERARRRRRARFLRFLTLGIYGRGGDRVSG